MLWVVVEETVDLRSLDQRDVLLLAVFGFTAVADLKLGCCSNYERKP